MSYNLIRPSIDSWSRCIAFALVVLLPVGLHSTADAQTREKQITVDDFEDDSVGTFPDEWVYVTESKNIRTYEETRDPGEEVVVKEEEKNKFLRLITKGEVLRYSQRNGKEFEWSVKTHPRLEWRWRAQRLPEGASEKGKNDTGGAVYVTFGTDWLGRPKSIKYTYSSSLPMGTVVSFGVLKVIVVSSATEPRQGAWKVIQRNVINDYRQVFGGDLPNRPVSITVWSDSDTTGDMAKVDIDDIKLLPAR